MKAISMAKKSGGPDVVALVDDVLTRATRVGASDVHFEPTSGDMLIRFRLDGVLNTVLKLPGPLAQKAVSRLKVLGGLVTYRNDIPQEGGMHDEARPGLDRRVSIFPTIYGQRAVVRLFQDDPRLDDLDSLGFSNQTIATLKAMVNSAGGMLLVTGPAGSGKSTTLAAILRHILKTSPGKSIVALEDPVERHIEGVTQVRVNPQGAMTFPVALRSLLRQDPQVLMLGEIRDAQTAAIAVEAALTGHFLMSTLHSGTPSAALLRLLEMGIEPYQVTSSVLGIVNQRLLRRLCANCKKNDNSGAWLPVGCPKCFSTGYHGRILVAEMLSMTPGLRQAVLAKADVENIGKVLEAEGHRPLALEAQRLLAAGITSQAELNRISY